MPPEGTYDPTRTRLTDVATVRSLSGYTAVRDIDDAAVGVLIDRATSSVVNRLAKRTTLRLAGPVDGANTRFMVPSERKARIIADDTLDLASTGADVLAQLRTDAGEVPTFATVTVNAVDALNGIITLAAAPATTVDQVLLTARFLARQIDRDQLQWCIELLTAHLIGRAVNRPGKVNVAAPPGAGEQRGGGDTVAVSGSSWLGMYEAEIRKLTPASDPALVGADTSLPSGTEEVRTSP